MKSNLDTRQLPCDTIQIPATSPISRAYIGKIPPEILSYVFDLGKRGDVALVLIVSWVSVHWRSLALSTPSLWDTISILNSNIVLEYLKRNPTGLINLVVQCSVRNLGSARACLDLLRPHQTRFQDVFLEFLDIETYASSDIQQCRSIVGYFKDFLQSIDRDTSNYRLRTLSIEPRCNEAVPALIESIRLPAIGTLRTLCLREIVVQIFDEPAMENGNTCSAVQSLSMVRSCLWAIRGFGDPVCYFVQQMPHLEQILLASLYVYEDKDWASGTPLHLDDAIDVAPVCTLDRLNSLRVLRTPGAGTLLSCLHAPQLRHFEWEEDIFVPDTPPMPWKHCASQFQALTSLHLLGFPSEGPNDQMTDSLHTLSKWLESLHSLQVLNLIFDRSCLYDSDSLNSKEHGVVAILRQLSETQNDVPLYCKQLRELHIGPVLPGELEHVQSASRARLLLRTGKLRVLQYTDTQKAFGDTTWLETSVADFKLVRVTGHGQGCGYGTRIRYVGGKLLKIYSEAFDPTYFKLIEAGRP